MSFVRVLVLIFSLFLSASVTGYVSYYGGLHSLFSPFSLFLGILAVLGFLTCYGLWIQENWGLSLGFVVYLAGIPVSILFFVLGYFDNLLSVLVISGPSLIILYFIASERNERIHIEQQIKKHQAWLDSLSPEEIREMEFSSKKDDFEYHVQQTEEEYESRKQKHARAYGSDIGTLFRILVDEETQKSIQDMLEYFSARDEDLTPMFARYLAVLGKYPSWLIEDHEEKPLESPRAYIASENRYVDVLVNLLHIFQSYPKLDSIQDECLSLLRMEAQSDQVKAYEESLFHVLMQLFREEKKDVNKDFYKKELIHIVAKILDPNLMQRLENNNVCSYDEVWSQIMSNAREILKEIIWRTEQVVATLPGISSVRTPSPQFDYIPMDAEGESQIGYWGARDYLRKLMKFVRTEQELEDIAPTLLQGVVRFILYEDTIDAWKKQVESVLEEFPIYSDDSYTCPVCGGIGSHTYISGAEGGSDMVIKSTIPCNACGGTGRVWPPPDLIAMNPINRRKRAEVWNLEAAKIRDIPQRIDSVIKSVNFNGIRIKEDIVKLAKRIEEESRKVGLMFSRDAL